MKRFYSVTYALADKIYEYRTAWFDDLTIAQTLAKAKKCRLKVHNVQDNEKIRELNSKLEKVQ